MLGSLELLTSLDGADRECDTMLPGDSPAPPGDPADRGSGLSSKSDSGDEA